MDVFWVDDDDLPTIAYEDLRRWGIPWTKVHIYRLCDRGLFPSPFCLGARTLRWTPRQIKTYLANLPAWVRGRAAPSRRPRHSVPNPVPTSGRRARRPRQTRGRSSANIPITH